MNPKPNCYQCKYKRPVPGHTHIRCANTQATVEGNEHGIKNGWFFWPLVFDPAWLISCDGFADKNAIDIEALPKASDDGAAPRSGVEL